MEAPDIFDTPPPYQAQSNSIYLPDMYMSDWPSSYYGRSRRIDLAKFYHDILKATSDELETTDECEDPCSSSVSSNDEDEQAVQVDHISETVSEPVNKKTVTFSADPPVIHEYEPEYEDQTTYSYKDHSLFDDGWPGRTKSAMNSTSFMDFKSKIEAKLGAINDPTLVSQLDTCIENVDEGSLLCNRPESSLYSGYRSKKSPSVKRLSLRPIPNSNMEKPSSMMESLSPPNSCTDSPLPTPEDTEIVIPDLSTVDLNRSVSPTNSSNGRWLKTLSKIRRSSITLKSK